MISRHWFQTKLLPCIAYFWRFWGEYRYILWMALYSWVPIFVDRMKMTHLWGSKFVAIVFPFIIHTDNYLFVGTGIRGSDPPRKQRILVPHEN